MTSPRKHHYTEHEPTGPRPGVSCRNCSTDPDLHHITYQENGDTLEAYRVEGHNLILVAIIWAGNTEAVNVTFERMRPPRQFPSTFAARRWIEENC